MQMRTAISRIAIILTAIVCLMPDMAAQRRFRPLQAKAVCELDTISWYIPGARSAESASGLYLDSQNFDSLLNEITRKPQALPRGKYGPVVFDHYRISDTLPMIIDKSRNPLFAESYHWLDDYNSSDRILQEVRQQYEIAYPYAVKYNSSFMPEVPKEYRAYVDESKTRIVFEEMKVDNKGRDITDSNIDRKHWLHTFDANLQFSQAYISPNWYQGGNNNLNMIGHIIWNLKLNQKFYPKYLFEMSMQYKLAMNSAPDDSIHSLNITEDVFQFNATMGYKAARRWYYSANVMFKTQLFNSYPTNSRQMKAALLSPGELNVGLGMTYNYTNSKKTFAFGASISPVSWNMKTCISEDINPTAYGLDPGRKIKNKVGSSAECTLEWKIAYNIIYHSRLFLFTDYDYAYGDWEHTIDFNINRFLSTRLYAHMRYDTSTPKVEGSSWHKFQFKEIFSFGFSYHFGTI